MKWIKNLLALIGLLAIVAVIYVNDKVNLFEKYEQIKKLDPKAKDVYTHMINTLLETGNIAKATVVKYRIKDSVPNKDVVMLLNFIATQNNLKPVGDLPLSKQVSLMTGKKQRYVRVLSYCNPLIAMKMVKYSMAYGAYLPCRIVLMEAPDGLKMALCFRYGYDDSRRQTTSA